MEKRLTDALDNLFVNQGLTLAEALEVICKSKTGRLQKLALFLLEALREGNSLSNALKECPFAAFDSTYVTFVMLSERTGKVRETITFLKKRNERLYQNKMKLIEAALYPLFVILLSISIGIFLLKYSETAIDSNLIFSIALLFLITFIFFIIVWKCIKEDKLCEVLYALDFLVKNGNSLSSAFAFAVSLVGLQSKLGQKLMETKNKLEYGLPLSSAFTLMGDAGEMLYFVESGASNNNVFGKLALCQEEKYKQRRKFCLSLVEPVFIGITGSFLLILVIHIFMPFMTDMSWL